MHGPCVQSQRKYLDPIRVQWTQTVKKISGVNGLNKFFHLCAQEYFVLWTVEDTPSGTEWRVKEDTTPVTFQFTHAYRSTKTCIQRGRHPNAWIHNHKLVTVFKLICSWILIKKLLYLCCICLSKLLKHIVGKLGVPNPMKTLKIPNHFQLLANLAFNAIH